MSWGPLPIKSQQRRPVKKGLAMSVDARRVRFTFYRDLMQEYRLVAKNKVGIEFGTGTDAGKLRFIFDASSGTKRALVGSSNGGKFLVLAVQRWIGGPDELQRAAPLRFTRFQGGIQVFLPVIRPQLPRGREWNSFLETAGAQ